MNDEKFTRINDAFQCMGTAVAVEITVADAVDAAGKARKAIGGIKDIFAENERIFSRFDPDSELSRINANIGKRMGVSEKMFEVLELCLKFYELSEGYFDPRVLENLEKIGYDRDFRSNDLNRDGNQAIELSKITGGLADDLVLDPDGNSIMVKKRIDTTGIAKGYAVDEVARFLEQQGFADFIVDAGGDMQARGIDADGARWTVDIEGMEAGKLRLKLDDEGVATSGISRKRWIVGDRKFHHLVNPKDPENFSYDIKTVTVIEKKTVEADGRAKVLVLMGKEKGIGFADRNNIKALFLDYRGNVYLSKAMKEKILN
ncbi:MAG: FAD:protein FMN transferase [Candidatus Moranbacteria bacterium]|nr:FAD:protein FMN transferase [Candidatus Moranbacteria bacterium]